MIETAFIQAIANYGIMVVISGVFITMALIGFKRILKTFDEGFKELGSKLDVIRHTIESQRDNHIDYDVAKDLIRQTYFGTSMRIQEELMRILHHNDIHSPDRMDYIITGFREFVENLEKNDFNCLKNLYYRNSPLCNVMGSCSDEVSDTILDVLYAEGIPIDRKRGDLYRHVAATFNKLTSNAISRLPK